MSARQPRLRIDDRDALSPLDPAATPLTPSTADPADEPPTPLASRAMFFDLSLYSAPKWESDVSDPGDASPPSGSNPAELIPDPTPATLEPPTVYDTAVARINSLDAFLTPSMKSTLTCLLSVMQQHLSPPASDDVPAPTNPLFTRIASDETPDHAIKDLVDTIEKGLLVFSALGGGSTVSVATPPPPAIDEHGPRKRPKHDSDGKVIKTTRRSERVRRDCKRRDPSCQICRSIGGGDVAHIIPYSAKDQKGIDFWKFVELFRGAAGTAALKAVALAPTPDSGDTLTNVWFLCKACHDAFGRAKIAVIPDLAGLTYPYDADLTASYTATIEFPRGAHALSIACWKPGPRGRMQIDKALSAGHVLTLRTSDARALPLPHPLLFQIHAVIARIVAMKAAGGFPLFPEFEREDSAERGVPVFVDPASPRATHGWCAPVGRWVEMVARCGLKREREREDEDLERPRKYTVVLAEGAQRMREKRELADRRMREGEGVYWCG